ncbi:MAG: TlpA disulfide reductase family protein [Candidatus Marinimicrobia bacterium]|jgi:peroxiredoxin|nr:TlpA disulfide reductase family protein [Candidatus Neomarinimicrobiota bacterium]MDP6789383.1 TlpA disulfide reductase family protein [Candidatus Neomarinimicrobiota bacterium]
MKNVLNMLLSVMLIAPACSQKESSASDNNVSTISRPAPPRPENAVPAPDFTLLNSVTGDLVRSNELLGDVVLLTFWGTWCYPCKKEIPDLNKLYEDHKKNGLEIVGVTLNSGSANDISSFANEWEMEYLVLSDITHGETDQVQALFSRAIGQPIYAIPTTFLIDRQGYIVKGYLGPRTYQEFIKDIQPYL